MARPLRIEYSGAFYHIIQRGNLRGEIFITDKHRTKFFALLRELCDRYSTIIHAYCLMNNHYHLILETRKANLSKVMHYLNASYSIYFNKETKRSGHVFQGRYKSILVDSKAYLGLLSCYIHLNPVRAGIVKDPLEYRYSSYKSYVTGEREHKWLSVEFNLLSFANDIKKARVLYKKYVIDSIGLDLLKNKIVHGFILGRESFVAKIKKEYINGKKDSEIPVLRVLMERPAADEIRSKVIKCIGDSKLGRKLSIYLIRKYSGLSLREISAMYKDISDAGISILYNRVEKKRREDNKFNNKVSKVENKVLNVET